jgi:hypothetical protein
MNINKDGLKVLWFIFSNIYKLNKTDNYMIQGLGLLVIIPLILMGALFFVFWIVMLIDSITRKFKDGTDKVVWVLVNILLGLLGSFIYYFVIARKYKPLKWFWWILLILLILTILFGVLFFIGSFKVVY